MTKKRHPVRRVLALASVIMLAAVGLAACGDDSDPEESGTKSSGGVIRALLAAQPGALDPINSARSAQVVWATMIEPLISVDEDLNLVDSGLVTSWERTTPTEWTFELRPDIAFSNGEKADAEAVVNTLELTRDGETSQLKQYFTNVTDIQAPDATTVVLTTKIPQYNIAELLTTVYLIPPKYYEEKGPEGYAAAPVGTGPYLWDGASAGRDIKVKVNPDYWGEKPLNDGVVFTWAAEASQRLALLQSGAVDVAFDLPPVQAAEAESAGLNVVSTETAMKMVAFLDSTQEPFTDASLREAAALAIDREAIVDGIFDGKAVADGGLLNVKPGEEPGETVEPDPERAKELVGDSSPTVQVMYPAAQYTNIKEVSEAVGGSLEAVGFKVKYEPLDYPTLVQRVVGHQAPGIAIFAAVPNAAVPDYFASAFMAEVSLTKNCPDEQNFKLIADALQQDSTEAAASIYDELNTRGVVEQHCYVPLYKQVFNYATAEGVEGVVFGPLNTMDFTKATL